MSSAGGCTKTSGRILSSESDFLDAMGLRLDENSVVLDEKVPRSKRKALRLEEKVLLLDKKAG
jgi:hypothetical protein